jgi:PKD repeat protein
VFKVTSNYKSYCYSKSIFVSEANIPAYDTIAPEPSFTYYYNNNVVYFVNTSSYTTNATKYLWDFGDGKATETSENPNHSFSNGIFNVVLKVSNSKYTVVCTQKIEVPYVNRDYDWTKKPIAKFVYSQIGKGVYFQNASSNITSDTKYYWTFGDGETNADENPSYVFAASGTYSVVLKVTNDNISDSYSMVITVP